MADQLDMFAAPAPPPAPVCPHHDAHHICAECSPTGDTDHTGFCHRGDCKGRLPLRRCKGCGKLKTPGHWNHASYWWCSACVPLGSQKK